MKIGRIFFPGKIGKNSILLQILGLSVMSDDDDDYHHFCVALPGRTKQDM